VYTFVACEILLSQILDCVDNAEIKLEHESVVTKINTYVKELNSRREKEKVIRSKHRGIKSDPITDIKYSKEVF